MRNLCESTRRDGVPNWSDFFFPKLDRLFFSVPHTSAPQICLAFFYFFSFFFFYLKSAPLELLVPWLWRLPVIIFLWISLVSIVVLTLLMPPLSSPANSPFPSPCAFVPVRAPLWRLNNFLIRSIPALKVGSTSTPSWFDLWRRETRTQPENAMGTSSRMRPRAGRLRNRSWKLYNEQEVFRGARIKR